ncbi:hypothetical protein DOY81_007398 [Sarcophaga bullata]|nr:hypothetical protein DOY81_007398 [Sarcophaga bullata]
MPYRGIVDSSRLKKWVERNNYNNMGDSDDGSTYEFEDYEFIEEFLGEE